MMKTIINPAKDKWEELYRRSSINKPVLEDAVNQIFSEVQRGGDAVDS